jgi:hypothetical protein
MQYHNPDVLILEFYLFILLQFNLMNFFTGYFSFPQSIFPKTPNFILFLNVRINIIFGKD